MLTRSLIKHAKEPAFYVIEADEDGVILAALDVSSEVTSGGLCRHMVKDVPLLGQLDDVERLNRERAQGDAEGVDVWLPYVAECGNVHHLMTELLALDRDHRAAAHAYAVADAKAKSLKKEMDARGEKVHELLGQISDRKPLPLFEAIGG
jgi:hypothetical protein